METNNFLRGMSSDQIAAIGNLADFLDRAATKTMNLRASNAELLAALRAVHAGFMDGTIKWAKPRQADSEPYHPANILMTAALAKAEGKS